MFLTNQLTFGPTTIARIYKDRWQIELLFKALKQHLKVKTFVGTSANALHIQLWTALIALLVLKYLQLRSTFGWSLSNLVALLQFQLFTHRDLWAWLNEPFTGPPRRARGLRNSSWRSRKLDSRTGGLIRRDGSTCPKPVITLGVSGWISANLDSNDPQYQSCLALRAVAPLAAAT